MQAFILALHVLFCIVLVVVVLLQSGKEGMGVIFGGGSSSLFGSSGAGGLLTKVTAVVAALFIITSMSYTYLTRETHLGERSVMDAAVEQQLDAQQETPKPEQGIVVDDAAQKADDAGVSGIQTENAVQDAPESGTEGSGDKPAE